MENHNEIKLPKKIDLNIRKLKIIHHPTSEESHPVTEPLGKIVE